MVFIRSIELFDRTFIIIVVIIIIIIIIIIIQTAKIIPVTYHAKGRLWTAFQRFYSVGHINLHVTAAQIHEFCHLFWLKYRWEHSARKAIFSNVQEIKLRRDSLIARICHLVNVAKYTSTLLEYKNRSESIEEDSVGVNEISRRDCQNEINVTSSNNNLPVMRRENRKRKLITLSALGWMKATSSLKASFTCRNIFSVWKHEPNFTSRTLFWHRGNHYASLPRFGNKTDQK